MHPREALNHLGCVRTIWIDDLFNESSADLADKLLENWEFSIKCELDGVQDLLPRAKYDLDGLRPDLIERLDELGKEKRVLIREKFAARQSIESATEVKDLSAVLMERLCNALDIQQDDRWDFDRAASDLAAVCEKDDSAVSYIVDLNDGHSETRGLDILRLLLASKSRGTAFILTHEAAEQNEASKESELREQLKHEEYTALALPICVVSKERLSEAGGDEAFAEALRIGIKRAGLRKSLFDVISAAEDKADDAFQNAAARLLSIPPEQLEAHVFERGFKEGVSELHVVERIVTSHISKELRMFFGTDQNVLSSAGRLRKLRAIKLAAHEVQPDENLAAFRLDEVWESEELINEAHAPIACGDVFETDCHEKTVKNVHHRFVLLGQPCDIALRPVGKERTQDTAFLVPLIATDNPLEKEEDSKMPLLPCKLNGRHWACDLRNVSIARLSILDLASFRKDGRIRIDEGHEPSPSLLAAQSGIYAKRTAIAKKAIEKQEEFGPNAELIQKALQLTFNTHDGLSFYHSAFSTRPSAANGSAKIPALPRRLTWRLRRSGRVRMPYAVALLNQYLNVMSRQAFDLDYIAPGFADGSPPKSS